MPIKLVTDLPVWESCPFKAPSGFVPRKGQINVDTDDWVVAVCYEQDGKTLFHADCGTDDVSEETFKIMINNVSGAILDAEFPGISPGIIKRRAEFAIGKRTKLSEIDLRYLARSKELTIE